MTVSLFRDASEGAEMPIVYSCNVFSDHQVRSAVAKEARRPRMSEVYVKRIMDEGDAHAC